MADVFISYAREDAAEAERLAAGLQTAGYTCWWDRHLVSGARYLLETDAELKAAKAVIVIWSQASITSHWVADEAACGRDGNRLAALSFDGSTPPLGFRQFQVTDFAGWRGGVEETAFLNLLGGLRRLVSADIPAHRPSARALAEAQGNLPRRLEPLIGRRSELREIADLLAEAALVTLTGPGGVGKTRLAIEVAQQAAPALEDGAFLIELALLSDPAALAGAIARGLGVELGDGPAGGLPERLRSWRTLIVLDNCEHLIDAAAELAERVLAQARDVRFLVTSQEVLGVEGERVVRLRSLEGDAAQMLFLRAVRAADPEFAAQPPDTEAIRAICQRLDGVALAIEMAAAEAPVLGYRELLSALDDRFSVLTAGRRTALPRQRTLQATLDWSHSLLTASEARVFRRLAVFAGGCTLEAARGVVPDEQTDQRAVTQALAVLVRKSLVFIDRGDGPARYRLLETMRAYAQQKLLEAGETQALQERHAAYFARFFEPALDGWIAVHENELDRYSADLENFDAAADWAFSVRGEPNLASVLVANGGMVLHSTGRYTDGLGWINRALSLPIDPAPTVHARLMALRAIANCFVTRPDLAAIETVDETVPEGADRSARILAICARVLHLSRSNRRVDLSACRDELARLGVGATSAASLVIDLAEVIDAASRIPFDPDLLGRRTDRLVSRAEQAGSSSFVFYGCAHGCGMLAPWLTDPARAILNVRALLNDVLVTRTRRVRSNALPNLTGRFAMALCERNGPGDIEEARALYASMIRRMGAAVSSQMNSSLTLASSFTLPWAEGRRLDAVRVMGAMTINRWFRPDIERWRARMQSELAASDFERALSEGGALSLSEAMDLALKGAGPGP